MDLLLSNKVAIVTGASRGIGKAIAQILSAEGMKGVLVARSSEGLGSLAKSLRDEFHVQPVDLRQPLHFLHPHRLPAKASRARSWMWMAVQPGRYEFWKWQYNSTAEATRASKVFAKHPRGARLWFHTTKRGHLRLSPTPWHRLWSPTMPGSAGLSRWPLLSSIMQVDKLYRRRYEMPGLQK